MNDHNGTDEQETTLRLLKLTEEAGEAAQAYIGMRGQNPRKGTTHTAADVTAELADVILTAMVAMHSFTDDPESALNAIVRERARRLAALLDTTPF
ncbi:MazG-like family protein [Streptomyces sp. NPDC050211]|uniref:MazG-like family protein n=1 Tax=Streptomyces sp. NPDC050211 TaxID=3154932 RepID=UPI0034385BE3